MPAAGQRTLSWEGSSGVHCVGKNMPVLPGSFRVVEKGREEAGGDAVADPSLAFSFEGGRRITFGR